MKKIVALLVALTLLSIACAGLAEETEKTWKEHLADGADALIKDVREKAQDAADTINEKAGQLSQTVKDNLDAASEKAKGYAVVASFALEYAKAQMPNVIEQGKTAATEKVEELTKQISGTLESAADALSGDLEQIGSAAGEKANELSKQVTDILSNAKDTVPQYIEQAGEKDAESLDKLSTQAADALTSAKETVPQYLEKTGDALTEKVKNLSDQVSGILTNLKNNVPAYAQQAKDTITQTVDNISQGVSGFAQSAKKLALEGLGKAEKAAINALQTLVNWLKGSNSAETPVPLPIPAIPTTPAIHETGNAGLEGGTTAVAQPFYPVPGYDFYFGMTWKQATALPVHYLSDSQANAYERARALVMLNQQNTSLYFLWFVGETEEATLFEVDEFAFSAQDTLVPPQDANGQYSFITTDNTVNQVYSEKALSCGSRFGSPLNLESGLFAPSLMFDDNDVGISQTQVYFPQDQAGALVVSHFIYTTDCGINVIIYQYTNAS